MQIMHKARVVEALQLECPALHLVFLVALFLFLLFQTLAPLPEIFAGESVVVLALLIKFPFLDICLFDLIVVKFAHRIDNKPMQIDRILAFILQDLFGDLLKVMVQGRAYGVRVRL